MRSKATARTIFQVYRSLPAQRHESALSTIIVLGFVSLKAGNKIQKENNR